MAAAGSAIGLGTLWKFPYVAGANGGGLFILIYLVCTFFIGIPVFMAELMLGRRAQRGAVGIFTVLAPHQKQWKLIGWLGVMSSFLIMSYYSVVAGWGMSYVLMSLNRFYEGRSSEEIAQVFETLAQSGGTTVFWHFVFTAVTVAVVYHGVRKGIEQWSKVMTSSLLVLLLLLLGYSMTLDGFSEAVHFIFSPNAGQLRPSGVLEALGLAFFTLSLGQGIMLTYGSYMRPEDDIPQTSLIIGCMDIVVSLLAALMIFPIIFTFGFQVEEGPGLVFKTLPVLFAQLPGAFIISTMFFTLFVFTALTSSVALVEVVVANLIDLLDWSRKKAVLVVGVSVFLFGIPSALSRSNGVFGNWKLLYGMNFFETVDALVSVWFLPMGGFMTALFVGWFWDRAELEREFKQGTKLVWLLRPWFFFIRWVAPVAVILILLHESGLIDIDRLLLGTRV